MSEILHGIFSESMGGILTAVFLVIALVDVAMYRLVLGPMYDRQGTPEARAAKPIVRMAVYGGAMVCALFGLVGVAVLAGLV